MSQPSLFKFDVGDRLVGFMSREIYEVKGKCVDADGTPWYWLLSPRGALLSNKANDISHWERIEWEVDEYYEHKGGQDLWRIVYVGETYVTAVYFPRGSRKRADWVEDFVGDHSLMVKTDRRPE